MLDVSNLVVRYGAATALWDVSLRLSIGELVCVVGPNGAGKTTLIGAIAGVLRASGGQMHFKGLNLVQRPAHRFCSAGIALVPEGRRLFTRMTVLENLELGSYLPGPKAVRRETLAHVLDLFPALRKKLGDPAGSLSGGQQQMVAIGRALMAKPSLLLLDEPSLGLAPSVVLDMFGSIRRINAAGTSVLLVEQNVALAMELAHRAYVMEEGRIVCEGSPSELLARPEVRRAYLGIEAHAYSDK